MRSLFWIASPLLYATAGRQILTTHRIMDFVQTLLQVTMVRIFQRHSLSGAPGPEGGQCPHDLHDGDG